MDFKTFFIEYFVRYSHGSIRWHLDRSRYYCCISTAYISSSMRPPSVHENLSSSDMSAHLNFDTEKCMITSTNQNQHRLVKDTVFSEVRSLPAEKFFWFRFNRHLITMACFLRQIYSSCVSDELMRLLNHCLWDIRTMSTLSRVSSRYH